MKTKITNLQILILLVAASFVWLAQPAAAQSMTASQRPTGTVKTDSRILYHNGLVMTGPQDVYFIWYGCWNNTCGNNGDTATQLIMTDFMSNVGATPYYEILTTYTNADGYGPSGAAFYGGSAFDQYSRGTELTISDLQGIVSDQITNHRLPQDPNGIYVVLASADVSSPTTGFCVASAQPYHGTAEAFGSDVRYAFVGNPMRCPSVEAPQFVANGTLLPTPNGSLAGDAMANTLAHVLNTTITNPTGTGWFDRYDLQNADKCDGQFGTTYLTTNGARANIHLGQRDYLIQQIWVNDKKGHCTMDASQ
jgi:hypothetical protein